MFDGLDNEPQAIFVAPVDLVRWADAVRPHLARMAGESGGRYETPDIFVALAMGKMQLWLVLDGALVECVMVTEIQQYPRMRALRIIGLVGFRPLRWRKMLASVEKAARDNLHCTVIEAMHLPRLGVLLPGFKTTHWFGEKVL